MTQVKFWLASSLVEYLLGHLLEVLASHDLQDRVSRAAESGPFHPQTTKLGLAASILCRKSMCRFLGGIGELLGPKKSRDAVIVGDLGSIPAECNLYFLRRKERTLFKLLHITITELNPHFSSLIIKLLFL
jgi:hypothetical protein